MNRALKLFLTTTLVLHVSVCAAESKKPAATPTPLAPGQAAPEFKIKDSAGKEIVLSELTAKGPVLVRLTCGCLGCDRELPFFQALHTAYEKEGLTSLAVFREPDAKVEQYVRGKELKMLYAVDTKGASWATFKATAMPTNILIAKGGKITAVAAGCDPSGLVAQGLSEKAAALTGTTAINVKANVEAARAAPAAVKK